MALAVILCCSIVAALTSSCKDESHLEENPDDITWDIAPLVISVKVVSPEGYSVLNSRTAAKITAIYHGQTYACVKQSREYMPDFFGLTCKNDYLLFGELSGTETYHGEELILDWGDGSKQDTITFSHRLEWKEEMPTFHQEFRLNGKVLEGQIIIYKDLKEEVDHSLRRDMPLSTNQLRLVYRINNFGFDLFRKMYADLETPGGSCVASPLSVSYILGMLATGARPDFQNADGTRAEIIKALDMTEAWSYDRLDPMNNLFKTIIEYSPMVDTSIDIQLANAFFTRKEFTVYGGYLTFLAQYYQADYELLDFTSPTALDHINGWCSQKTKGLIPRILDEINPNAVAYLLNAIYFRGGWRVPFEESRTKEGDFTKLDGNKVKHMLMHQTTATSYAKTDLFEAVRLPFGKDAYNMQIILPNEGHTVADVIAALDAGQVKNMPWEDAIVTLTLPRFEVASDYDELPKLLETMGIRRMFTPTAEFTEISPDAIYVSKMRQKARIKVDEDGCEAAAVTIAEMEYSTSIEPNLPEVTFTANRPFVYLITEQSSGAVFFIGTYAGE